MLPTLDAVAAAGFSEITRDEMLELNGGGWWTALIGWLGGAVPVFRAQPTEPRAFYNLSSWRFAAIALLLMLAEIALHRFCAARQNSSRSAIRILRSP